MSIINCQLSIKKTLVLNYLHKIGWFVGLVLLQVLILNNVHIAGYATPFLYIYLILKFESETPRNALMLWAFFLGLTVDIFSDTPGMLRLRWLWLSYALLSCVCLYRGIRLKI